MLKSLLRLSLIALSLWVLVFYLDVDLSLFKKIDYWAWPLLIISPLIVHLLQAELFRLSFRFFGVKLSFLPNILLTISNTFLNLIAPMQTASVLRAAYMKRYMGVDISRFMGAFVSLQLAFWVLGGLLLLVFVLLFPDDIFSRIREQYSPGKVFGVMSAIVILFLLTLGFHLLRKKSRVLSSFRLPSFNELLLLGGGRTLICLVSAMGMWLISVFMAQELDLYSLFLITLATSLSVFFVLTPGNVGIVEGAMYFFATLLGMNAEVVLLCVLLDRFLFYVLAGLGAIASALCLKEKGGLLGGN